MEKETPLLCLRVLKIKTLTAIQPTSKHSIEVNMARSHSVPYVRLTAFKAQVSSVCVQSIETGEWGLDKGMACSKKV